MVANYPKEIPFTFDCEGSTLLGVIHESDAGSGIGLLTIVAGGPQYRGGCGRQLVELGRFLATQGIPVMRFDHRGLGDSAGEFLGFQHLEADLKAAIQQFKSRVPTVKRIVLWGGCDAASAALINAYKIPEVRGIIASNPWITAEKIASRARRRHYLTRIRQRSFWRKLIKLEYNLLDYAKAAARRHARKNATTANTSSALGRVNPPPSPARSFLESMLEGLNAFDHPILLVMSGRSVFRLQFEELLSSDQRWRDAFSADTCSLVTLDNADQTFTTRISRDELFDISSAWIHKLSHQYSEPPAP